MTNLTYKEYLSIALILAVIGILGVLWQRPWEAGASVEVGNQYQSTTTPQVADLTNLCPKLGSNLYNVGSSTSGVVGSVNVLGSGTGQLALIDATTSVAANRQVAATSSLILAWFPTTAATTSMHFDIEFKNGLLVDYTTGVGTTTISYRCEGSN